MIWTDAPRLAWEIVDWRIVRDKGKRVATGALDSDGRAFVPYRRNGEVLLPEFGRIAYRDTTDRTLADQLHRAKPTTLDAARPYRGE